MNQIEFWEFSKTLIQIQVSRKHPKDFLIFLKEIYSALMLLNPESIQIIKQSKQSNPNYKEMLDSVRLYFKN